MVGCWTEREALAIYTLPCVKEIASGKLLYCTGSLVGSDDLGVAWGGGWEGAQRERICVYLSLIHTVVQQKLTQQCKAITRAQSLSHVWLFAAMDYSPPGLSVHGILQARTLESMAIFFSRRSSWHRDETRVPCIAGGFFTPEP